MATDTKIRIHRNPYNGYEVWIREQGELIRRSFDNSIDLATKLVGVRLSNNERLSTRTIEAACDLLDVYEWDEPEYPLGVSYRPVGEAVCDEWVDFGCDCEMCSPSRWQEPPRWWDLLATSLRIGAVTAPWVLLVIGVRVAWAKAVAWGWV